MLIDASSDVSIPLLFTDPATGECDTPDALPKFRVLGMNGPVANAEGTVEQLESGAISAISTGATTTITSTAHGLATGAVVEIANAAGTTGVNGVHPITVTDANNFTFNDVVSSGTYTSGATWVTPGLFAAVLDSAIRAALEVGRNYLLICYGIFGSDVRTLQERFTVVS